MKSLTQYVVFQVELSFSNDDISMEDAIDEFCYNCDCKITMPAGSEVEVKKIEFVNCGSSEQVF